MKRVLPTKNPNLTVGVFWLLELTLAERSLRSIPLEIVLFQK